MANFPYKTISYNLARKNLPRRLQKPNGRWDKPSGQELLGAFRVALKGDFLKEFLDDLLTEADFKRFTTRLDILEHLSRGAPYSFMSKYLGWSVRDIAAISKKTANKQGGYYRIARDKYPRGFKYFE